MATSYINIRIGRLPGRIQEIALNGDRDVATALATAGLDASGFEIRVQGQPASPETTLAEGDLVLLVKKIKGNADEFVIVRVGRVPGPGLAEVAVTDLTVGAALAAAEITLASGEVVFVNDEPADGVDEVADGDAIVVRHAPLAVVFGPPPDDEDEDDDEEEDEEDEEEEGGGSFMSKEEELFFESTIPSEDKAARRALSLRQQGETLIARAEAIGVAMAAHSEAEAKAKVARNALAAFRDVEAAHREAEAEVRAAFNALDALLY